MFLNKVAIRRYASKQSRKKNYAGIVRRVKRQGTEPSYR